MDLNFTEDESIAINAIYACNKQDTARLAGVAGLRDSLLLQGLQVLGTDTTIHLSTHLL